MPCILPGGNISMQFKTLKLLTPFLVSLSWAMSLPAGAAQPATNMAMSLDLTITETMAPTDNDPERCPATSNAMAIGMLTGSGFMTVTIGPGPKIVSIPVMFAGSDCPTGAFQFSSGKFTLSTPSGHQLFADYYGGFYATSPTALVLDVSKSAFVINSGTGFFAGASGTGTLHGNENVLNPPPALVGFGNIQAKGTIAFKNPGFANRFMKSL
jgi:hypothetical protein